MFLCASLTWKMSTLKWFLFSRWLWLFSSFFTCTACLSRRTLTSFKCPLVLRERSSSLSTFKAVVRWFLVKRITSPCTLCTAFSRSACRCSIRCWLSCTASIMFTSLSSSATTVIALTCPRSTGLPGATAPGLVGILKPNLERVPVGVGVGEDEVGGEDAGQKLGMRSSGFSDCWLLSGWGLPSGCGMVWVLPEALLLGSAWGASSSMAHGWSCVPRVLRVLEAHGKVLQTLGCCCCCHLLQLDRGVN